MIRLEYFELLEQVDELDLDAGTIRMSSRLPMESTIFEGHFPKFPILPGVMMLEIMNQTAGFMVYLRFNRERFVFLGGVKRAKFRRMVKPGAAFDVSARITHDGSGFFIAETSLRVDDEVAADAEIVLIVQDFPNAEAKSELSRLTDGIKFVNAVKA